MSANVALELHGTLAVIWLTRPAKLNAITPELLRDLNRHVATIDASSDIRVGVLAGRGRSFCSGADLSSLEHDRLDREEWLAFGNRRTPFVGVLQGHVWGGGLMLALDTDIRVATQDATFLLPEARRGRLPQLSLAAAARSLPSGEAALLALGQAPLSATRAFQIGMVQRLAVDFEAALQESIAIARDIAELDPSLVEGIRNLLRRPHD